MTLSDLLTETGAALTGNKVRTGLTMLGIVIGISSVIALVGVGQGATSSVTSSISSLGSNLIVVSPGAARGAGIARSAPGTATTLTADDVSAISALGGTIKNVAPELSNRYQLTAGNKNSNTTVTGTMPIYTEIRSVSIQSGTFFSDEQVKSALKVAVLGPTTRDTLFGTGNDPIGKTIKIKNISFKVIGVTTAKGGSGFNNPDDAAYIPITAAQRYLAGKSSISGVDVEATDSNSISAAEQSITDLLLSRHHITDSTQADFSLTSQQDIISSLSTVSSTLTLLLGAISGISLLVGGIGIMNMMLTTVTERTREIGLRKAIGATSGDIATQFLVEAIMLTFVGGLIGILLGWGIASIVTSLGIVTAVITWQSIVLAFGVSALVGIVFGYYPARRASRLSPIEALRYE